MHQLSAIATPGWIMIGVALLIGVLTLSPWLIRKPVWRATVTPLASIIGSGFLVAGPILGHTAGRWAVAAMMALCATAWLFGSAIRTNIAIAEPLLKDSPPRWLMLTDRGAELTLIFAYFISVAYYLNLFAAFALRIIGSTDTHLIRLLTSAVIVTLGLIGLLRGLRWLENIELPAVGLKLALIGGLIAALGYAIVRKMAAGGLDLSAHAANGGTQELRVLLGLVILVQGFETSRYLGQSYAPEMRVRSMRYAQLLATAIYGAFIFLITPYFVGPLPQTGGETAIIGLLRPLSIVVAPLIIATALASQLSAAVADMNGAGGLVETASQGRLGMKLGYAATALVALGITWIANIYEIIVYATKAFVLYYAIQSGMALRLRMDQESRDWPRIIAYGFAILLAIVVLIFGVPAEGGD